MNVSHTTLKILAAITWYIGVIMLLTKGYGLAQDAEVLEPEKWGKRLAWIIGVTVGIIKTRYIFDKSCKKNLNRIAALKDPKLWEFYRRSFFVALALMITLGATLSRISEGNYISLVAVAALDISIGTALLLSSREFWLSKMVPVSAN